MMLSVKLIAAQGSRLNDPQILSMGYDEVCGNFYGDFTVSLQ